MKNIVKEPIEKIFRILENRRFFSESIYRKHPLKNKKEIISKLKGKFELDKIKPKALVKQYSKDIISLKKHGFKVMEHKKPEPKHIVPLNKTHTKRDILNHFKEVYKHD